MEAIEHAQELAVKLVGNWRKFGSFWWHEPPACADECTIVYFSNRDSGLLEESNAACFRKALEPFAGSLDDSEEPSDVEFQSHGHWAVGHVDGAVIRVYRAGKLTPAFLAYAELKCSLEEYPVLDESDYSEREDQALYQNTESMGRRLLRSDATGVQQESWVCDVLDWLHENIQGAVENRDDQGGCPSDDELREAMAALGLLEPEESEDE